MSKTLAGTRIRQLRRNIGKSQKDLAKEAGISSSYLNLIEHNRRDVAGKVLLALAKALDVPTSSLSDSSNTFLAGSLAEIASNNSDALSSLEEFIARFPSWAKLAENISQEREHFRNVVNMLNDRLSQDPMLSESLHAALSQITAIRSTAEILRDIEDIPEIQRRRFLINILQESHKLTSTITELISYLEPIRADTKVDFQGEESHQRIIGGQSDIFKELETLANIGGDASSVIAKIVANRNLLTREELIFKAHLDQYYADACSLPLRRLDELEPLLNTSLVEISERMTINLPTLLRRLSVLSVQTDIIPDIGAVAIANTGTILFQRSLNDFPLSARSAGCSYWPVYRVEETGLSQIIAMPTGRKFNCFAWKSTPKSLQFNSPGIYERIMIIVPQIKTLPPALQIEGTAIEAGNNCRICPRQNCSARLEPNLLQ